MLSYRLFSSLLVNCIHIFTIFCVRGRVTTDERLHVYLVEESVTVVLSANPEHRIGVLLAVRAEDQSLALGHEVLRCWPLLGPADS